MTSHENQEQLVTDERARNGLTEVENLIISDMSDIVFTGWCNFRWTIFHKWPVSVAQLIFLVCSSERRQNKQTRGEYSASGCYTEGNGRSGF